VRCIGGVDQGIDDVLGVQDLLAGGPLDLSQGGVVEYVGAFSEQPGKGLA
jgi:hypothetical protein